jgi:hypothetical protein
LRQLRETTEDIRAWDAGYLSEDEPTAGRHALTVAPVEPVEEPPTVAVVPGAKRAMWYDLIADWANVHDPAVAVPRPPKLQPLHFAATQLLPIVVPRALQIGVDVTRQPQIDALMATRRSTTPTPLPSTTWPIWGSEPFASSELTPVNLGGVLLDGIRAGLVEFEDSGQWVNARLTAWFERFLDELFPPAPAKVSIRPKRVYAFTASTTRWEYRGGAR